MRKRKHRLCTSLLCAVLVISNTLSVATPVYAKSPYADSSIETVAASGELIPATAEDDSGSVPADPAGTDQGTGNSPDSDPANDSGGNTPGTNEDTRKPSEPGTENPVNPDDPEAPSDTDGSDKTEDPTVPGNPDDAENPDKTEDPDNPETPDQPENPDTPDNPDNTENPDDPEVFPGTDDPDNSEEDDSVSDNDIDTGEVTEEGPLYTDQTTDASDYLTEDPNGYNLSDIQMTPGSYAAEFSAVSKKQLYNLSIVYTDNTDLAAEFFKGKTKASEASIRESGFTLTSFNVNSEDKGYDSTVGSNLFNVSASFTGEGGLLPDTTYSYRLVYYSGYDSTEQAFCYSFLTVPMQFTTGSALETSSVKISEISVEDAGYQNLKVVWTIDNPENEALFDIQLRCTDSDGNATGTFTAEAYQEKDEKGSYHIVPNKYCSTVYLSSIPEAKNATAKLTTYIGNKKAYEVTSESIALTPKSTEDTKIQLTEKLGSASFQALLQLSPYYSIDNSIGFTLYYREKAKAAWQSEKGYVNGSQDTDTESGTIRLTNLTGGTDYEYYIVPTGPLAARDFSEVLGSEENPRTFTTKEIKTYTDADFPDEIFRNYIKGAINSDTITSDKLEKLTSLNYSRSSASGNISSLRGIEYIENLTSVSFEGHTITDVSGLSSLTELTSINLNYNDLTQLPDLSAMTQLRSAYFNGNMIGADSITESKLPASLLANYPDWISNTIRNQRSAEVIVTFAPEYYASGDTQPFLVKVEGLKQARQYTLSLTVGGKTISADSRYYTSNGIYYIQNILKDASGADTGITITQEPCTVAVTLTDSYGNTWVNGETAQVTFTGSSTPVVTTQYIKPTASSVNIRIDNLPVTYALENIAGVSLVDQTGAEVGNASRSNINVYDSSYNPYEDVFGDIYISNITDSRNLSLYANVYFAKYLTAGDYKAVITMTDQTSATFEKAVCVDDIAVVERLYTTYSNDDYDNYGDYLYLYLDGTNIDPAKIYPVLYEDGQAVTEFVSGSLGRYGDTYVYKLRKLETTPASRWNFSGSKTFDYDFTAVKDYDYVCSIKNKRISIYLEGNDFVTFEHYNYKKGVYEVKTDSTVKDGTKVTVSVYNASTYADENCKGTAEGTVTDSFLSLIFTDKQGETYAPPRNSEAYFRYTYTDSEGKEHSFNHANTSVKWYNYYTSGTTSQSSYTDMVLYHKAALKDLAISVFIPEKRITSSSVVTAQITDSNGTSVADDITLSKGSNSNGYIKYNGTWKSDAGLGEGVYSIRFLLDDKSTYTAQLYVYDDSNFYMNGQWMGTWTSGSTKGNYVSLSSEQLAGNYIHDYNSKVTNEQALAYWNKGNYKLELFDRLGKAVTGWKLDHASWNGSDFNLYLTGVPDGYIGFYVKITRAGTLGIKLTNGRVYYADAYNASEEYGEWETLTSSNVWFNDSSSTNAYYGFGSYAYPVTVTITRPYDTTPVDTFTVSKATNGNYYYFTASDLSKTDPKEAYRISAVSVDGSARSEVGYLAVRNSSGGVVNPTGITLNKTSLNLQRGESEVLTATVKPDNATSKNVTWASDNTAVATVDQNGKVTAAAVGTAKITAATDNSKTAICTVTVTDYTLNQANLEFDLGTEEGRKPQQLMVQNGDTSVTSNITWSSTDESVATVTSNGVVTPEDAGEAIVLAAIKNGPTLECRVTVSNDTLTAVALSESSCALYVAAQKPTDDTQTAEDDPQKPGTKTIKLYYSPNKAEIKPVEWKSSDETVASVSVDASDPTGTRAIITAHTKGTTDITATVTTKSGSTMTSQPCTVTVKAVTSAEDAAKAMPQGLAALTNEQLTLGDVSLEGFPGWAWLESEKSVTLAQFAGMQQKAFAATYTDPANPDAEPYETAIPVAFSTVTGISIQAESSTVQKDKTAALGINWSINGAELDMTEYVKKVEWSVDKAAVATIQKDADGKAILTDGKATLNALAAGKATVKAQITFKNNKILKAQYKLTVTDGAFADIQITAVDNFTPDATVSGVYRSKLDNAADSTKGIHVTVTGASKLTVKNSSNKVIVTGKIAAGESAGSYLIPLTVKAAGMAKITLVANDTAKTQKDIFLYVTDVNPSISEDPVTVNLQQTGGAAFMLYPSEGYQVTSAKLSGENVGKFTLTPADPANTASGNYILSAAKDTATGTYKLSLEGKVKLATDTAAEESFSGVTFTVKVIDQKPKYTVKQTTKFNLFYKDWESRLEITCDEPLSGAELKGCDFNLTETEETDGAAWYLTAAKTEGLTSDCNKKGSLTLTFDGYQPVETDFTVATEYKKPKITLAAKSATLYPESGINSALIRLKDGKADYVPTAMPQLDTEAGKFFNLKKNGESLLLTASAPATLPQSIKATLTLQEPNWAESIALSYTVKVSKNKPGVKLGKTTLQLNANSVSVAYDMAATQIMWKDGAAFNPSHVSFSAANSKSKEVLNKDITFAFDEAGDQIIAKLHKTDPDTTIATGSYKFKVNVIMENGAKPLTVSAPFTVKITNVEMTKAIKISTKGSIDVLNREKTFVTVTPSLKSINGTVTKARLTGNAAHLFEVDETQPITDNKIILRAKANTALITKYAYKVKLNLTIENAEGDKFYYLTPDISLKLKQGKPKVTIAPKTTTFSSGAYNHAVTRKITATLKGADNPIIENVELLNNSDSAFVCNGDNAQDGTFTLSSTENAVKGKTYKLQLKITFKDQADNEKATIVKYSAKIK